MTAETRLLIADDDDAIRALLGAFFGKKGFDVVHAADGEEASAHLCAGVDIAILDLMMPKKTGMQVLEETRELGITTPILLATAHGGESEAVVRALEVGADDYIDKPFDLAVLHARVLVRLRASRAAKGGGFMVPPSTGGSGAVAEATAPTLSTPFVAAEGAVLDGRYELQRPIGKGSFGVVWRARHLSLESDVAVKLLNTDDASGGTPRLDQGGSSAVSSSGALSSGAAGRKGVDHGRSDELRLEGVRASRVKHHHAVRVLDVGALQDGTTYLVMELLDGMTVDELLRRHGALPIARVVEILTPVAEVLAYAHSEGVIHRDVKPANVMLHGGPSGELVKVLDFGVAKLIDVGVELPAGHLSGESENSARTVAGSPAYLAPERLRGTGYDGRADVYSLGVMLYELLTGSVPFLSHDGDLMKVAVMHLKKAPEPPSRRNPSLPPAGDALVLRLLEKDPQHRPTALQVIDILQELLSISR